MRRRSPGFATIPILAGWLVGLAGPPMASAQRPETPKAEEDPGPRYKFSERYADPKDERNPPGSIGQYRVAYKLTIIKAQDRARGTPDRKEATREATYTERPARNSVTRPGQVVSMVRRYESARFSPDPRPGQAGPWPLEGLTIWYHFQEGGEAQILNLTPKRRLRDSEFKFIYDAIAVPKLIALLPAKSIRKGDAWRIAPEGISALLGMDPEEGDLTGTFLEVRDDLKLGKKVAVFEIAGRLRNPGGDVGVRARLQFAFEAPAGEGQRDEALPIEAVGAIVKLNMSQSENAGVNAPDDRLRIRTTRQLILERRFGGDGPTLEIPDPLPKPTPENSWLTHVDGRGRFWFQHPQELRLREMRMPPATPGGAGGESVLVLGRIQPELGDLSVRLFFVQKATLKPDDVFKKIFEGVRIQRRLGVTPGDYRTLNWKGGIRVLRKEAMLKPSGPADAEGVSPVALDAYLIQFSQDSSLMVEATTSQDPPADDRKEVEQMLKTFKLGPPPKED